MTKHRDDGSYKNGKKKKTMSSFDLFDKNGRINNCNIFLLESVNAGHCRPGQNNARRSCGVIWSAVGFVCLNRSFGVDRVHLSRHFCSLSAYFLR
jgi:hypothetical protein